MTKRELLALYGGQAAVCLLYILVFVVPLMS